MKKFARFYPLFGLLGFAGILGFFLSPFFFVFFGFYGLFFIGLLLREKMDERLIDNFNNSDKISSPMMNSAYILVLLALALGVSPETVLLWGSIGYAAIFIQVAARMYTIDKWGVDFGRITVQSKKVQAGGRHDAGSSGGKSKRKKGNDN